MVEKKNDKEISAFDLTMINIMTHLYKKNAVDDEIMNHLKEISMERHLLLLKNNLLEEMVNIDTKTNLLKYRDDYLTMILKSASRTIDIARGDSYHISFIRFDIDDFSLLNNRFGHENGDRVLIDFANLLKEKSRPTDYVIRFGGEEFDVLLPATPLKGAYTFLEKIYEEVNGLCYDLDSCSVRVTASAGVSYFSIPYNRLKSIQPEEVESIFIQLQKDADNALYDAKVSGKKQYKVFDCHKDYKEVREEYTKIKLANAS